MSVKEYDQLLLSFNWAESTHSRMVYLSSLVLVYKLTVIESGLNPLALLPSDHAFLTEILTSGISLNATDSKFWFSGFKLTRMLKLYSLRYFVPFMTTIFLAPEYGI